MTGYFGMAQWQAAGEAARALVGAGADYLTRSAAAKERSRMLKEGLSIPPPPAEEPAAPEPDLPAPPSEIQVAEVVAPEPEEDAWYESPLLWAAAAAAALLIFSRRA